MKKFICKNGASNFYFVDKGMRGFLNPPTHPEHFYGIIECRGGYEVGRYSLSSVMMHSWMPRKVQGTASGVLKQWSPGKPDEAWIASVYNYFRHCYSRDGIDKKAGTCITYGEFWGNAELEQYENPEHHLGYMFVKSFYPEHQPDLERIRNNDPRGEWSREEK